MHFNTKLLLAFSVMFFLISKGYAQNDTILSGNSTGVGAGPVYQEPIKLDTASITTVLENLVKEITSRSIATDSLVKVAIDSALAAKNTSIIGVFTLINKPIPVYDVTQVWDSVGVKYRKWFLGKKRRKTEFVHKYDSIYRAGFENIKKVELFIEEGLIKEITIFTQAGNVYSWDEVYIPLRHFKRHAEWVVYRQFDSMNKSMYITDIFRYIHKSGMNFIPDDTKVELTLQKSSQPVQLNNELNAILDLRTYTDMYAVIGEEGNGLAQIEASTNIFTNTKMLSNRTQYLNYIQPRLRFSKFDNDFGFVKADSVYNPNDSSNTLWASRTLINQRRFASISVKVNVLKRHFQNKSSLELNSLIDYSFTKIGRSEDKAETTDLFGFGLGLNYSVAASENFVFRADVTGLYQRIAPYSGYDNSIYMGGIRRSDFRFFLNSQFELDYNLKEDRSSQLFLRYARFNGFQLQEKGFSTLQLGTKFNLSR